MKIEERFLNYVKFDTTSDPDSETTPSSMKQKKLAQFLVDELHELGIENAFMNEYGEVYAHIEANSDVKERIGFIAHMDTSPDCSGKDIHPQIIRNYDGEDIVLNSETILSPKEFTNLYQHFHQDLIVTDGTTLLGADDKAGIAIIMSMAEHIVKDDSIKHGYIGIAFTCDEEVGRGADNFDLETFNCDYAYTVDGGDINVIAYENFNAYEAIVHVHGKSVHPGDAKGKMVNASLAGMQFHACLDPFKDPAVTEGYEGFHHLTDFEGQCEQATLSYILRDHDENKLAQQIKEARAFADKFSTEEEITIYLDPADSGKQLQLQSITGVTLFISKYSFGGGTRAVLPNRNILIDNSFESKLEEARENFRFTGGIHHAN